MTKLLFLGSGSAFTLNADNFQSNMFLISENQEKFLIDCGTDIRFSLDSAGFSIKDVTDIYISHLHADHVGGLEYIAFNSRYNCNACTPNLYVSEDIVKSLWENSLSGGLRYLEGEIGTLESFFNVHTIDPEGIFMWEGITFQIIKTLHVKSSNGIMPSYGLFFEVDQVKVFITSDSQFCPDILEDYYQKADLIFQDCELAPYSSPVHAHYGKLASLPPEIKNKMWLYGYQPGELPKAEKDGFLGFVKRGNIFDFKRIL